MTVHEVLPGHEQLPDKPNPYELKYDDSVELARQLLVEQPPVAEGKKFVSYEIDGSSMYADMGRQLESQVFFEAFRNTPQQMLEEYGPREDQSTFFVVINKEEGKPHGALRVIRSDPDSEDGRLKTLEDLEKEVANGALPNFSVDAMRHAHKIDDMEAVWDIGTVAVPREFRGGAATLLLYRHMYVASQKAGIKHFISMIDKRAYKKMKNFAGFPFEIMHGAKPVEYLGSGKSYPVYGDAPRFEDAVREKRDSKKPLEVVRRKLGGKAVQFAHGILTGDKGDWDTSLQLVA